MTEKHSYIRATFNTPAHLADEAAGILVAGGALGCAVAGMTKPHTRAPKTVTLEAYFDTIAAAQLSALRATMAGAGLLVDGARDTTTRRIVDPGWSTIWMKRFGPFHVGRRFLIVPPWNRQTERGRVTVVIEPAQAFGTGHHPTTAGALRAIEAIVERGAPRTALDVGTGSGVLAIAMAMLGARQITALDIDSVALENARSNARLNHVERAIRFSLVPLKSIRHRYDLITANIFATTLIDFAPRLTALLAPAGRLVIGGILADEADDVMRHYRPALRCLARKTNRGWTTLVLARAPRAKRASR